MAQIAIVDDHPIFLDGMAQFLSSHGHDVLFCARSVQDALDRMGPHQPDLLILDVSMNDGGGLAILSALRKSGSTVPVIFMTVHIRPEQTLDAVKLGVDGIVLKDSDPNDLLTCIGDVLSGNKNIAPSVMSQALAQSISEPQPHSGALSSLTEREREIAGLIRIGLRNREIAQRCGLTEGTVKVHLHSIFQKLGIKSRSELIILMIGSPGEVAADSH